MKRKLSSDIVGMVPPISTKQTITSHLNTLNINKTTTYGVGNMGGGGTICGEVTLFVPLK
jgi:hypothetical protein